MKKFLIAAILVSACLVVGTNVQAGEFTPSRTIEAVCTSSPGGGSDMFIRTIADIIAKNGFLDRTIMVNNQTDGGGLVARNRVRNLRDDHIILVLNSGDLLACLRNSDMTIEHFTPLAVMAKDTQLLAVGKRTKQKSFAEVLAAVKNGEKIVFGGSKSDDMTVHGMMVEELVKKENVDPNLMPFIPFDATSDAITALLGGHIDVCGVKPAASREYVKAGELTPILTFGQIKAADPLFENAPTIVELGYDNVEFPVWRSIVASGQMTPEAAVYWTDLFKKVYDTDAWKAYLQKSNLTPLFVGGQDMKAFMELSQTQMKSLIQ